MITIALCDVAITITNTKHLKKVLCTKASKNKKVLCAKYLEQKILFTY